MAKTLLDLFRGSPHDTGVQPTTITAAEQDANGIKTLPIEDINDPDAVLIEDTFNVSEHASDVTADDITASEQDENGIKTFGITDIGNFTTTPILDIFNSSEHSSDDHTFTTDENIELFNSSEHSSDNHTYTTNKLKDTFENNVESKTQNYFTQETSGIRLHSLVELNNPLLYGTGVPRIALRTTATLNEMRKGTNAEISPQLTDAMNAVNGLGDLIGLPKPMIPSRMVDMMKNPPMGPPEGKSAYQTMLDESGIQLNELGGTPLTVGIQSVGALIRIGKEKLRSVMLGRPPTESEVDIYSSDNPYVKFMASTNPQARNYKSEGGDDLTKFDNSSMSNDFVGIDLSKVSPVFGVTRNDTLYGNTKIPPENEAYHNAFEFKNGDYNDGNGKYNKLPNYTPKGDENYSKSFTKATNPNNKHAAKRITPTDTKTLEAGFGLRGQNRDDPDNNYKDVLNTFSIGDTYKTGYLEGLDLIPFWIGRVGDEQKTHFRALLNGISETVSPSWSSNNFFGNPFAYHTYTSIERSVTFGLQMYCSSELELQKMWERISTLTSYTYPSVVGDPGKRVVNPPIIEFRLGDIYNNKKGYLDSLSYTFPDNGTWEIEEGKQLPKVVDVSISIKFIEQWDDADKNGGLYQYNPKKKTTAFSTETQTE